MFRAEKFFKRLFGINRLNGALQQLEKLRPEEALMAGAEALEIVAHIDQNVIDMGSNVAGMTGQLRSAHADVRGLGHEVHSMNAGDSFFSSLSPESVLSLTRSGVTGAREDMQVVLKYVSDLNRS